jgi:hypothetical protein
MSDEELKDVVREYLAPDQLVALVERRALLVERVRVLVDRHGADGVFYQLVPRTPRSAVVLGTTPLRSPRAP